MSFLDDEKSRRKRRLPDTPPHATPPRAQLHKTKRPETKPKRTAVYSRPDSSSLRSAKTKSAFASGVTRLNSMPKSP
jgi:hypothetical protein